MRGCVKYIHDPDSTVTFDLKVKFIGFMTWLCVFVLWHSHTLFGTLVYHHGMMCCVHSWTLYDLDLKPPHSKLFFLPWIWVWQDVFALWYRHSKFWHMGVSPWDNMLCTFLTLLWSWPLIYMWVAGGILSEFYSQFFSCCFENISESTEIHSCSREMEAICIQ